MTNTLAHAIADHLDEIGDTTTSDRAEQQIDSYRAWLDTREELPRLATSLGLLVTDRESALATARTLSAEVVSDIRTGRVA
mgnify:CR=1 FL=1